MAKDITTSDFSEKVENSEGLVMVDFWADWCGPCKMLGPVIEEVSEEHSDKVAVYKLDVDENQETAQKYKVMAIPTVIVFKDGKPIQSMQGVQPKEAYVNVIENNS